MLNVYAVYLHRILFVKYLFIRLSYSLYFSDKFLFSMVLSSVYSAVKHNVNYHIGTVVVHQKMTNQITVLWTGKWKNMSQNRNVSQKMILLWHYWGQTVTSRNNNTYHSHSHLLTEIMLRHQRSKVTDDHLVCHWLRDTWPRKKTFYWNLWLENWRKCLKH